MMEWIDGEAFRRHQGLAPTDYARACAELCIGEIRFVRSGYSVSSRKFIEHRHNDRLGRIRVRLRDDLHVQGKPRLRCALCGDPLNIAARAMEDGGHSYYFLHPRDPEGKKPPCPYRAERPDMSDVERWRYHGQRESVAHKAIKAMIARSLGHDARMSEIVEEKVWIGPEGWRKPDVSASWRQDSGASIRLAFEAQLSTTFVTTVVERQDFYRKEGAATIWMLGHFDAYDRRAMVNDVLFWNNCNVFVVNQWTEAASAAAGKFMLEVHWHEPILDGEQISGKWRDKLVAFESLAIDQPGQRCFYRDVAGRRAELVRELAARGAAREATRRQAEVEAAARLAAEEGARRAREEERRNNELARMVREFVNGILSAPKLRAGPVLSDSDYRFPGYKDWYKLDQEFKTLGIEIPWHPGQDWRLNIVVQAIVSVREGRAVGWRFKKLVEVAHHLSEQYPYAMELFGWAVRAYGRREQLDREDTSERWRKKAPEIWKSVMAGDPQYVFGNGWDAVLALAFPEILEARAKGKAARPALIPG